MSFIQLMKFAPSYCRLMSFYVTRCHLSDIKTPTRKWSSCTAIGLSSNMACLDLKLVDVESSLLQALEVFFPSVLGILILLSVAGRVFIFFIGAPLLNEKVFTVISL